MARQFVLRRNESFEESFRRIAASQLTRVADVLSVPVLTPERRIHDVRKRFKESRALLRLFRQSLGDAFDDENRWYRDAGRRLAEWRDAAATVVAVGALSVTVRRDLGAAAMGRLRDLVRERHDAAYGDGEAIGTALRELLSDIDTARKRTAELPFRHKAGAVEAGFAATMAAGRKAMSEAYGSGDPAAFHEWRKRVKDHWYHIQLFVPVWPAVMKGREEALDKLSHLLGDYHDLVVIGSLVRGAADSFGGVEAAGRITAVLTARQRAIARQARPLGERLYASRPNEYAREVMTLWRAWHRR